MATPHAHPEAVRRPVFTIEGLPAHTVPTPVH